MSQLARRNRDADLAIKLSDGTYLIRSGCCRPGICAPAAGVRCCLSVRCACDWPGEARFTTTPTPPAVGPDWLKLAFWAGAGAVCLGLCAGAAWFVVNNIVAVVLAAGVVGGAAQLAAVVHNRRKCRTTVTTTITHEH